MADVHEPLLPQILDMIEGETLRVRCRDGVALGFFEPLAHERVPS